MSKPEPIVILHILPMHDTGHEHIVSPDCLCQPSKNIDANPRVPIYKHRIVGESEDKYKIRVQTND